MASDEHGPTFSCCASWHLPCWPCAPRLAAADDVRYYDQDGITYRETVQTTQRAVPQTTMQPQSTPITASGTRPSCKTRPRTYQVPITEYQWKPETHRTLESV